jgi:hypothetical protein
MDAAARKMRRSSWPSCTTSVARQRGRGRSGLRSFRQRPSRSPAAEYTSVTAHQIHASAS